MSDIKIFAKDYPMAPIDKFIGYEEETSPTLRAGVVPAAIALEHHPADSRIGIAEDNIVQTLATRMGTGGGNVPIIMTPDGPLAYTLKIRCGGGSGGKGALVQEEKSATLATSNDQTLFQPGNPCGFDRYNGDLTGNVSQTIPACAGTSGDNKPMVFEPKAWGIGKPGFTGGEGANFNFAVNEEVAPTMQASGPDAVAFGISSDKSHAMLSKNPHAGIYEAETSRTLDAQCGHPGCHQGGIAVVEKAYSLQGNMIGRKDGNGPQGSGVNEDVAFTLNGTDLHGVAAPVYHGSKNSHLTKFSDDPAVDTLVATEYKEPPVVSAEPYYIVRRLTPVECARLQGFPDWWCDGLGTEEPMEEEVAFWTEVFETHRRVITGAKKPKTRAQIVKWLKEPYLDSNAYRMWGNGVCLSNAWFVLAGIVYCDQMTG